MIEPLTTRDKLLLHARNLFWARGFSNVSVRMVAKGAGVDVALISRHFGGKRGLFEETVRIGYADLAIPDAVPALVDYIVGLYSDGSHHDGTPSLIQMITSNAHDEEVGQFVRDAHHDHLQIQLEKAIGRADRAALLTAILIGFAVAEKGLCLDGIAKPPGGAAHIAQLRALMQAALNYDPD
ncbi:MAG: TetR/AcrR family transcriptional regulator [Pseudooceanicola sp.]